MDEFGKTKIKGKIRIVTPVHIGGAQEKHWVKGIDFIVKDNKIFVLDEKKIINKFGIEKYSVALANNKIYDLLKPNLSDYALYDTIPITGEIGSDIKKCIKNSLSQKPIIPGTSLKGSLRSVFYNHVANGLAPKSENQVFGKIHEDIFRFMIVCDSDFNRTSYFNTKTFNLQNTNTGGWKHGRNNTTLNFNKNGFTFVHEVIPFNEFSDFEITFNSRTLETVKNEQNDIDKFNSNNDRRRIKTNILKSNERSLEIFNGSQDSLFKIIYNYTKNYLKSEKEFFEKYKAEKSELIINQINNLINQNNEDTPLLRLGLGSGFHAMTGDTIHESHLIDYITQFNNRTRGKFKYKDSAKSRKIAFSEIDKELVLYPMGFVQLCSDKYFDANFKNLAAETVQRNIEKEKERAESVQKQKEKNEEEKRLLKEKLKLEEENKAKEEQKRLDALKPKYTDIKDLKKKKLVDAYVTGQNGKMLLFKPLIKGYENQVFSIGYASGMPLNTLIQVECSSPNGKTLQFQGYPKEKK